MSIRAQTLIFFAKSEFLGFKVFRAPLGPMGPMGLMGPIGPMGPMGPMGPKGPMGPMGPMGPIGAHGAHWGSWANGDPWALGPAATHPPGTETETETTDTATRAAPIANAPRDHIRRAGQFPPPTLIIKKEN